jgi:thiol-disulfide isomerase/thioredoxin
MKVIFYSEQCDYCKKLLQYLDKYNMKYLFKLINIDNTESPKEIDIVPTIIDTELNQPLKGKKAFEYLLNVKYFNNPTNNIDYIKDIPINPDIKEDDKAIKSDTTDFEININDLFKENESSIFYESSKKQEVIKSSNEMIQLRNIQDKKLQTLLKLRGIK